MLVFLGSVIIFVVIVWIFKKTCDHEFEDFEDYED